jgi:peptidoglycan/xylan/chitin deacetylase (PgdA/CDA1 family)
MINRLSFWFLIILMSLTGCDRSELSYEQEGSIVILMYHQIVEGNANGTYDRTAIDFENDLKYLKDNNIKVIDFSFIDKIKDSGKIPGGNYAIITFDDGDISWYNIVRPLLLKYGMKATFFLWTQNIGKETFLNWSQVEYMSRYMYPDGSRPFRFESHSYSHPYLLGKKAVFESTDSYNLFLDYEFGESRRIIESHTLLPVNILALPFGDGAGDAEIIAASERNGYKMIRTSRRGIIKDPVTDLYDLPSLPVLNNTISDQIGLMLDFN